MHGSNEEVDKLKTMITKTFFPVQMPCENLLKPISLSVLESMSSMCFTAIQEKVIYFNKLLLSIYYIKERIQCVIHEQWW